MNLNIIITKELFRMFIPFKNIERIEMYANEEPSKVDPYEEHYYMSILTSDGNTHIVNGNYADIYNLHKTIVSNWQNWLQAPKYSKIQGIWEVYGTGVNNIPSRRFSTVNPQTIIPVN